MTTEPRIRRRRRGPASVEANGTARTATDLTSNSDSRDGSRPACAETAETTDVATAATWSSTSKARSDYEVGYKKPPKNRRFKPGQSGNPKGRPRGSKNLSTLIDQELSTKVVVRKDGKVRTVSKREVVAMQLVKKGAEGQDRAIQTLLKLDDQLTAELKARRANDDVPLKDRPLEEEERAILAEFEAQIRQKVQNERDPFVQDLFDAFKQIEEEEQ